MTARLVPLRRVTGAVAELSDAALLAACATGDPSALGALFDRFHLAVYRFASRLRTTDELARDDLVQATFLEVARTAAKFRGASSVKTWILGIAANVARHQLRSELRRRVRQARYVEWLAVVPDQPDDQVDRRRRLSRIGDAIAALPYDRQVAFILCDLEQLPIAEVARVFAIPEGTLWRRLDAARKTIRTAVERSDR